MHHVSDIATDPKITWVSNTGNLQHASTSSVYLPRVEAIGCREGINIKVIIEPAGEGIITAYPIK